MADLTKRYGNLKNGSDDIKNHWWFSDLNFDNLIKRKIKAAYVPDIKNEGDTSNYSEYPDSDEIPEPIDKVDDPFYDW